MGLSSLSAQVEEWAEGRGERERRRMEEIWNRHEVDHWICRDAHGRGLGIDLSPTGSDYRMPMDQAECPRPVLLDGSLSPNPLTMNANCGLR